MPTNDDTMQQITRMIQAGWSVEFHPDHPAGGGGIVAEIGIDGPEMSDSDMIYVDQEGWQDDIPAAWARLVDAWKRQVGEETDAT